jgi:hypothetical protein
LGGFDIDRNKLWDSHNDDGVYTDYALMELGMEEGDGEMENVVTDVIRNSTLILSEEGVVIQSAEGVVTWMIRAPSVDTEASGSAATGSSSTSTSSSSTTGGGEDISVSGTVFLDSNGDGLRDSTSSSAMTFGTSLVDLSGMAVDLYDCADASNPEWLLLERTNSSGYYEFESGDLMPLLEERGTTQIRVVITLSDAMLSEEYTFSPMSRDSDVNPNNGRTICWDLDEDGKQPIVWNAGVTKAVAEETVATPRPTAKPVRPPTLRPTAKPSSNSNAANENSTPADSVPATSPSTSSSAAGSATSSSVILSGVVFHDENNDGFYEFHEEASMPDVSVELLDCDGNGISTGSTDDNGMYGFSDLAPGSYIVRFSPPGGYQLGDVWTGLVDDQGNMIAEGANNHANPTTGSTLCKEYQGGSTEYSLNAGMIIGGASPMPSPKPSEDPKGDGSSCSGAKCPIDGMCRNKSGLCGAGISFCNPESVWDPTCPDVSSLATVSDVADGPICNEDGSVGSTNAAGSSGEETVQSTILSFTYSLTGADGVPPDANSIAMFEKELNARLACTYFDDPCLACDNSTESISRNLRRRISSRARFLASVDDSSVSGISSLPKDEIYPEKGEIVDSRLPSP